MTQQGCDYRVLSHALHTVPAHATLCEIHTCLFLTLEFVFAEGAPYCSFATEYFPSRTEPQNSIFNMTQKIICENRQERLTVPVYIHLNQFPSPDLSVGGLALTKLLLELRESLAAYLSPMAQGGLPAAGNVEA